MTLNCITKLEDKHGNKAFKVNIEIKKFWGFLFDSSLIDMGFQGPAFTWSNNQSGRTRLWERLDRALANEAWIDLFPIPLSLNLSRIGRTIVLYFSLLLMCRSMCRVHSTLRTSS